MDAETRARYEAWKWRRIRKRVIIPGVGLMLVLIVPIFILRSCVSQTPDKEPAQVDHEPDVMAVKPQPIPRNYLDFDFTIYNSNSIEVIEASELDSGLILVNKVFQLPADFIPENLAAPQVLSVGGVNNTDHFLQPAASEAIEAMFTAALAEADLTLWLSTGYRSYETQIITHQHFVDLVGRQEGEMISARPGHCEHQTGLAVSITAASVGGYLIQELSTTDEGVWLRENAHRFGFIMRYPEDREELTGFLYEPWRFRYVGEEVAADMFENGIILEQYVLPYTLSRP